MSKCYFILLFVLIYLDVSGQQPGADTITHPQSAGKHRILYKSKYPFSYIGFSSGINNPSGLFGFNFEVPVSKNFLVGMGDGWCGWGNKLHVDGNYFIKPGQLGWAFTGGLAYISGVYNFKARLHTINKTRENVTLNMNPVGTAFIGASHYSKLGKGDNRFFIVAGWNVHLEPPTYDIIYNGPALAERSSRYIRFREPGGPMIGLGLLFGLHHYTVQRVKS